MSTRRRRTRRSASASDKWKNKEWVDIRAPVYMDDKSLGTSPTSNLDQVIGRTVKTSLMEITGNFKDLNYELIFKVTGLDGRIARTDFYGHELSRDFKRSQVRNHHSKVEGVYTYTLTDNSKIRITTFVVTPGRLPSSEKKELRKIVYDKLTEIVSQQSLPAFVNVLNSGELRESMLEVAEEYTEIKILDIAKVKVIRFQEDESGEAA